MALHSDIASVNTYAAPEKVVLVGGPANGRLTQLSKSQVSNGYEFVDGLNGGSGIYRKLVVLEGVTVMVHDSVNEPESWQMRKQRDEVLARARNLAEERENLDEKLKKTENERDAAVARLESSQKLVKIARDLLKLEEELTDV